MATIAPWLYPPNFLGAMQAGAQAGISLRGQDIAQQEREAQMALTRQQLEQQARLGERRIAAQQAQAAASLLLRASNQKLANDMKQRQLDLQNQRLEETRKSAAQQLQEHKDNLVLQEKRLTAAQDKETARAAEASAKLPSAVQADYNAALREEQQAVAALRQLQRQTAPGKAMNPQSVAAWEQQLNSARTRLRGIRAKNPSAFGETRSTLGAAPILGPAAIPTVTATAPTPSGPTPEQARVALDQVTAGGIGAIGTNAPTQTKTSRTMPELQRQIRVKSPDGVAGFIPEDQLEAAKAEGYTEL